MLIVPSREAVEACVMRHGPQGATSRDLTDATNASAAAVRGLLDGLLDVGLVVRVGSGPSTRYIGGEYAPSAPTSGNRAASLVGLRFGRLVVEAKAEPGPAGRRWAVVCDCGTRKVLGDHKLKYKTRSCGCLHRETAAKNGREALTNTPEAFWGRVNKEGPVVRPELGPRWPWTGGTGRRGYGKVTWKQRTMPAHRLAWILTNGPIGDGLYVCHRCDNPPCCRPEHHFLGTAEDNAKDMLAKGRPRAFPGEANANAKLSEQDVRTVLARRRSGETYAAIAKDFGVSTTAIEDIAAGRRWKHLERTSC